MILTEMGEDIRITYNRVAPEAITQYDTTTSALTPIGDISTLTPTPPIYPNMFFICSAIDITKELIPDILFIAKNEIYSPTTTTPKHTYNIELKENIVFEFSDFNIAIKYLDIFKSDFENINIREKYPEIFL